MSFELAL